jgi:hypothetical protein
MLALLVSLLISFSTHACEFSPKVKSVYSLAGSVTLALRDLDLIKTPKLLGISIFHPVDKKVFRGEILPGGIFLSHDTIKRLKGSVLFYDESREMTRILSAYPEVTAIQVKTRGLTPVQVVEQTNSQLKPFLNNCDLKIVSQKLEQKLKILKNVIPAKSSLLFFLGTIVNNRLPELLMVNDGVMKWLMDEKLIQTYPSPLSYVNWSAKILLEMPNQAIRLGVKDSGSEMTQKVEKLDHHINLTYPGALIPGSGQVEAMIYLFENLK